jgi:cytochrome c-type biogenesis protein CcmH
MPPVPGDPSSSGITVSGTITLAEELGSRILSSDVMYVMARKDGGTIAVRRVAGPSFPFSFEISGSDAMVAGTELSGPVDIVARVSKTGDAIAAAGDLEGTTTGVAVPAQGVTLTIDHVHE